MKKTIRHLFIATTLVAAFACKGDYTGQDTPVPISFSASAGNMQISSKAGAVLKEPADFLSDGSFALYGTWTVSNGTSANVFTRQTVTRTLVGSEYKWTYSPLRYWQKSGVYHFRAIYPISANTSSAISNGTTIVAEYSMMTEDYDLMVANSEPRDMTTNDHSVVPLNFRHALTAVSFVFQKGTRGASVGYHLDSFELNHLVSVGTLVFSSTAQNASLDNQWWTAEQLRPASLYHWDRANPGEIPVPVSYNSFGSTVSGTTWPEWHCVLPQAISTYEDEKPSVTFSTTIKTGGTYSEPAFTTILLPETYKENNVTKPVVWEAGKKYVYYIQIQPGGATIDVEILPWDEFKVSTGDLNF